MYKFFKIEIFLLAIIIVIQIVTIVYFVNQKNSLFMDEVFSYTQSSGNLLDRDSRVLSVELNIWHDEQFFLSALAVEPSQRFDFYGIYQILQRDVHPPFYHMQLHAANSLIAGTFSMWTATIINIIWLVATNIIVYKMAQSMLKSDKLALLPCLVLALSSTMIGNGIFFRMYAVLTFFFVALVYLAMNLIHKKINWKFYLLLFLVLFFGFTTHYYFIVFLIPVGISLLFWLLITKNYTQILKCGSIVIVATGLFLAFWPYTINHILGDSSFESAFQVNNFFHNIWQYIEVSINSSMFGGLLTSILIIALISILVILTKKKSADHTIFSKEDNFFIIFIIFCTIAYLLIIAHVAPFRDIRYIYSIFPTLILMLIALVYRATYGINKKAVGIILIVFCVFIVFAGSRSFNTWYFRREQKRVDISLLIEDKKNSTAIILSPGSHWRLASYWLEFKTFNRAFIANSPYATHYAVDDIQYGEEVFFFLPSRPPLITTTTPCLEQELYPFLPKRPLLVTDLIGDRDYEYFFFSRHFQLFRVVW